MVATDQSEVSERPAARGVRSPAAVRPRRPCLVHRPAAAGDGQDDELGGVEATQREPGDGGGAESAAQAAVEASVVAAVRVGDRRVCHERRTVAAVDRLRDDRDARRVLALARRGRGPTVQKRRLYYRACVCLSVCLSHPDSVSQRRKLGSRDLHCQLWERLSYEDYSIAFQKFKGALARRRGLSRDDAGRLGGSSATGRRLAAVRARALASSTSASTSRRHRTTNRPQH